MANPWWLQSYQYMTPSGDNGGGGYVETGYRDARTGQPVYQQGGQWYSQLPTADTWEYYGDETAGGYRPVAGTPGKLVDNSPAKVAQFVAGYNAPYGNLGGEYGLVDGMPSYLFPMARGATTAGDIGMYGGAQRAYWRSPSGAQGQVVQGPDGNLWVAAPRDATFSESDTADHSSILGNFAKDFAPLVMAALPFTGIGSALTSALGDVGGRIAMNAGTNLLSGGAPITGALSGAISGGAGSIIPSFDTGLGAPVDSALRGALTSGAVSAFRGGDILPAAIAGAGSSILNTGMQSAAAAGRDLVNSFAANPSPSTTVDTLAANTTGPNPAQAWGDSVDNLDAFLGQFASTPSPATVDSTINGLSQQTAGQTSSGPFQQPASSLPWEQPTGSLNTYTEQQPVTTPAEPVIQSPESGGNSMAFFPDLLGDYTGDMGEFSPSVFMVSQNPNPVDYWPTTTGNLSGDYSPTSLYDPTGTAGQNYLDFGKTYAPGDLNLGYVQNLSNSGTYIPDTSASGWDSFLKSVTAGASNAGKMLTQPIPGMNNKSILGMGLSVAPALAAINYATSQPGFDTSKLQSVYDQYNPSAQTGIYDLASQQQMSKLENDLARRGVAGSSFGDQSIVTQNTIRDLGRQALINQGLGGQADIAAKMLDAQAKERLAKNQLYGSALYSLGSALR